MDNQPLRRNDLEELFKKDYRKLVLYAGKFTSLDTAEDIVQDVFFQMLKSNERITIITNVRSYVYRAIKNKLQDYQKLQNTYQEHLLGFNNRLIEEELDYYELNNRGSLLLSESEEAVANAIDQLPLKCRAILKSRYYEGKRTDQISEEHGISIRTVETHIYKAIKQLRSALRQAGSFFFF